MQFLLSTFLRPPVFVAFAIGATATLLFAPDIHTGSVAATLFAGAAVSLPIVFAPHVLRLLSWAISGVSTGSFENPEASHTFRPTDRCARCGYSRAGLASPRCPECGEDHHGPWPAPLITREFTARAASLLLSLFIGASSGTAFLWADLISFRSEAAGHFASGATSAYARARWSNGKDSFVQVSPGSPVFNTD